VPRQSSLRHRILVAYVLLTTLLCGIFAIVVVVTLAAIEDRLIDQRLVLAADRVSERAGQGLLADLPPNVRIYRDDAMPPALRSLGPGKYELALDGVSQNILVRADRGGRFALVDNDSEFERIRRDVYIGWAVVFAAFLWLAVLLSRMTASRVIAPVTALARAVEQDDGMQQLPSIASLDEIGVLARAFAARTDALQEFLARERVFAGDVSHELRTPLTIILGAAELLGVKLRDRPELLPVAERIRRTAADTAERISALLLLSRSPERIVAPRMVLTPLVQGEIERYKSLLEGRPVVIGLKTLSDVAIEARPELAGIAIGNLIRNACQFTERGRIDVVLEGRQLVVEDTGPGIPASIRDRLFERHVRGSGDFATGSGLGLAIVDRVASHLGWQVRHEDRAGGGCRFIVTFPEV
jgi:signal transduction histidine kinase